MKPRRFGHDAGAAMKKPRPGGSGLFRTRFVQVALCVLKNARSSSDACCDILAQIKSDLSE